MTPQIRLTLIFSLWWLILISASKLESSAKASLSKEQLALGWSVACLWWTQIFVGDTIPYARVPVLCQKGKTKQCTSKLASEHAHMHFYGVLTVSVWSLCLEFHTMMDYNLEI